MRAPHEYPAVANFLDGLEAGGYWDEYYDNCMKTTPHPQRLVQGLRGGA